MKNDTFDISKVEELFKKYYKENKIKISKEKFEDFLNFLEIDFYDWVKENLRCYLKEIKNKTEKLVERGGEK